VTPVIIRNMHGAYFSIIKNVRFRRSLCSGIGFNQYVIRNLSTNISRAVMPKHDTNRIGRPNPYVNTINTVYRSWAYFLSMEK